MHDAITLGIPVLAIFFGILLNQRGLAELKADVKSDISTLKSDMTELKSDLKSDVTELKSNLKSDMTELKSNLKSDINRLESKIDRVQADLIQFNRELGRHDARLDNLESKNA